MYNNYNQYNDAFSNSDNMELDKLARELNNKRKAHRKAAQNSKNFEKDIIKGIYAYNDKNQFNFSHASCNNSQSDFVSGLPSVIDDSQSFDSSQKQSDLYDKSYVSDEEISSNYSSLPKKTKKSLRMNSEHLNKYKMNDDEQVLLHLKKCNDCKKQLLELLHKKHNIDDNYNYNNNNNNNNNNNEIINNRIMDNATFLGLQDSELKNILILIVIGIIIIIFIDVIFF
ncbi:hypothetical protein BMW23_0393 [Bodo saltans virus]|uniref:Uncharacterized protein n=1 Tax=Bodo saltans virus TaxID=2024608 RepID=A0A2H4UUB7_9VIRU|nr:hypothetical protein QJ851_gp0384 [Bodo saltans virus]ATZ80447.1 hypothetical protein BMW23_0393 [Bodo saltans virus]